MAQLHQLLAVEGDLEDIFKRALGETSGIFGRADAFQAWHERFEATAEGVADEADKHKEMVTTVPAVLAEMTEHTGRYLDAVLQKELTNQTARAAIVIDGNPITEDLPVTFLLGLENKLKAIRKVISQAPVLDPGVAWDADPDTGENVRKRRHPAVRSKTKKTVNHKILVQPTDHHPAQIEKWNEDVPVGKYTKNEWTGMLTPAEKTAMLKRLDKLARATKKARTKANEAKVVTIQAADSILSFVLGG